jgi:hypothetical protein
MLRETFGIMRELPRLHEIASVFVRHGLGDFVQRIGIAGVLERAGQILNFGAAAESVKLDQASRDTGPRVVLSPRPASFAQPSPPPGIGEQGQKRPRQSGRVPRRHDQAFGGVQDDGPVTLDVGGDDRDAAGHGFQ